MLTNTGTGQTIRIHTRITMKRPGDGCSCASLVEA